MDEIVCVSKSVYQDTLTRGKQYTVLAIDEKKRQVRIKGDNGRIRWFPIYCFSSEKCLVPTLITFRLDDPIKSEKDLPIEVVVELSNGEERWCIFTTPSALINCGNWIEGIQVPFHYGNQHIIISRDLSEDLIGRMLHYIDSQGKLEECTLPLA